ncbi:MAG: PilZ domain-containing protein [Desulfobacterales bacterium]|nr:PilZ domain-containing protein [Desulfobacterales bacterium]
MDPAEKRLYPRLVLKIEDGYFGQFKLSDGQSFSAAIVNLSAGGVNLAIPEKMRDKLKENDLMLLRNIIGGARLAFLEDIKSEVRWIKAMERPTYVSVGCRFLDIADAVRQQLKKFVDTERMTRGQYA